MLNSRHAVEAAGRFGHWGVEPVELDPAYAEAKAVVGSGSLTMTTQAFHLGDLYTLRGVYIKSPKIEIANLFLFPRPDYPLPLHVLEVVLLSGRPIAAILDQIDLSSSDSSATPQLVELRQQHSNMMNSDTVPEWFAACRSGREFFLRPDNPEEVQTFLSIHDEMLQSLAENWSTPNRLSLHATTKHALRIEHYKQHHAANAPGKPLLTSCFGAQWSEDYLKQCLFA